MLIKKSTLFCFLAAFGILLSFPFSGFSQQEATADSTGIAVTDTLKAPFESDSLKAVIVPDSLPVPGNSDTSADYQTIFDELYGQEIIQLQLKADLSQLIKNKFKGIEEDASLVWIKDDQPEEEYVVDIEARGKSRLRICSFPPIKLKFKRKKLKKRGLVPAFKTLKLVTHCFDNEIGERNVIKEFLVYKMYNLITDKSFRVQLARIEYIDTNKDKHSTVRYGFLIEDKDELAYRHQSKESPTYNYECLKLDTSAYCKMAVFQYMIGNQDWRVKFLHNIKLLKPFDGSPYIPVPYDFDYSGIINTSYAIANPDLPTTSVVERYFMGNTSHDPEEFKRTLQFYRDLKEPLLVVCENNPLLSKKDKKYMLNYLNNFFRQIKSDKRAFAYMKPVDW